MPGIAQRRLGVRPLLAHLEQRGAFFLAVLELALRSLARRAQVFRRVATAGADVDDVELVVAARRQASCCCLFWLRDGALLYEFVALLPRVWQPPRARGLMIVP